MKPHACRYATGCCCYSGALEPSERCPVHGGAVWPVQCFECGRFMSPDAVARQREVENDGPGPQSNASIGGVA